MAYSTHPPSKLLPSGNWSCRKCGKGIAGTGVYPGPCHTSCGPLVLGKKLGVGKKKARERQEEPEERQRPRNNKVRMG